MARKSPIIVASPKLQTPRSKCSSSLYLSGARHPRQQQAPRHWTSSRYPPVTTTLRISILIRVCLLHPRYHPPERTLLHRKRRGGGVAGFSACSRVEERIRHQHRPCLNYRHSRHHRRLQQRQQHHHRRRPCQKLSRSAGFCSGKETRGNKHVNIYTIAINTLSSRPKSR